jgi:hypothetical protein
MARDRYTVSKERQREFDRLEGEDTYQWIARQIAMATPFEATWLYLLRSSDENQRAAWEFHQAAVSARWSRITVRVAVIGTIANAALALMAVLLT